MRDSDLAGFLLMAGLLVILVMVLLAFIAGNIVTQIFAPFPSIAGPLGAAVALAVFTSFLFKSGELLFS